MLDSQLQTGNPAKVLETLVADAVLREKRARKRAVLYTIVPLILGMVFVGVSLYTVSRLQKTATKLEKEITAEKADLGKLRLEKKELELQVAHIKQFARSELERSKGPEAKEVWRKVEKELSGVAVGQKDENQDDRVKRENGHESGGTNPPSKKLGFLNPRHYRGRDKTVLQVKVIPKTQKLPPTPFSYNLDGVSSYSPRTAQQMTFSFTLDKKKNNPSLLVLMLDFEELDSEGYIVEITGADGQPSRIPVSPQGSATKTITYKFDII